MNHVVVAVLEQRRRLRRATTRDQTEMLRLRGIMRMQADEIRELQGDIATEEERTDALREQLHVANDRLTMMVREVRDWFEGIINECEALIQGVIGANAPVEGQGNGAPREGESVGLVGN